MSTDRQTRHKDDMPKITLFGVSRPQNVAIHQNLDFVVLDQCNTFSILRMVEKVIMLNNIATHEIDYLPI